MVRYSFLVRLSHPLLHAGLSRRIFDHLVRSRQHSRWNLQTDSLCRLQIDHKFKLRRLLHRQISGLCYFQNLVHICGGASGQVDKACAVAHKPSLFDKIGPRVHSREPPFDCEVCNLCSVRRSDGVPSRRTAPACHMAAAWNPLSISLRLNTSRDRTCTLNAPAARSTSLNACALPGSVELAKTATRESLGTTSFKSSICFPVSSGASVDSPVMFPPGRARLATNPFPTGSPSCAITMGIVFVASLAALVSAGPAVTMTSTLTR